MEAALEAIRNGIEMNTVAKNISISESKIRDRLKLGENYDPPISRKTTFIKEKENEMVSYISQMVKKFYKITQQQLQKLASDFAVAKNIKNIFASEKRMARKCWLYSFLKTLKGVLSQLAETRFWYSINPK
ncbi:hypothetical protein HHI36_008453 [Cryptolaemus montrouzieri]|uniref:HTH CENPB-type domain-containing protein n=1 Tax=Cryptolaemus montrouzieri TaxID=559131 RepID=A0ABD2MSM9_9CUCU